jgi:hypothetical protein
MSKSEILAALQEQIEKLQQFMPKPNTDLILCETCGKEWQHECACGLGVCRNILAFHDNIDGIIRLWSCEDVLFLETLHDGNKNSILISADDLTRIAKEWLAQQDEDESDHIHTFHEALDPHYVTCSCGVSRKKKVKYIKRREDA